MEFVQPIYYDGRGSNEIAKKLMKSDEKKSQQSEEKLTEKARRLMGGNPYFAK